MRISIKFIVLFVVTDVVDVLILYVFRQVVSRSWSGSALSVGFCTVATTRRRKKNNKLPTFTFSAHAFKRREEKNIATPPHTCHMQHQAIVDLMRMREIQN